METIFGLIITAVTVFCVLGLSNLYGQSNNKVLDVIIQIIAVLVTLNEFGKIKKHYKK